MPWLVTGDQVLASLEIASTRADRRRGLLGRTDLDGALLLESVRWVHTVGMKFAIDVAYLDAEWRVCDVATMAPHRVGRPRPRARSVVETRAGELRRWGIGPGDIVEIRR